MGGLNGGTAGLGRRRVPAGADGKNSVLGFDGILPDDLYGLAPLRLEILEG